MVILTKDEVIKVHLSTAKIMASAMMDAGVERGLIVKAVKKYFEEICVGDNCAKDREVCSCIKRIYKKSGLRIPAKFHDYSALEYYLFCCEVSEYNTKY